MNASTNSLRAWFHRKLAHSHGGLVLYFAVFLTISFLIRLTLLAKAAQDVSWNGSLLAALVWGSIYDLGAAAFLSIPFTVLITLLPAGGFHRRWQRWLIEGLSFVVIFFLIFGAVAEWTFWDEFGVRFNFIAVDYLVYTKEVIGNIRESYNLPLILAGVFILAVAMYWAVSHPRWADHWFTVPAEPFRKRLRTAALWLFIPLAFGSVLSSDWLPGFNNNFNRELAKNGLWSLFTAFKDNALAYADFYPTLPREEAFSLVRKELSKDRSVTLTEAPDDTLRLVRNAGPELRPNVIQITVESLSGDFLGTYNPASKLTPHLDEIAKQSLVFDEFYATGTRTDRGMEALSLAVPPTPGRSLVKRPRNEHLFTLGSVFRAKGYDTAFIYGGFGYFDNMNYYFGNNGYKVIDRNSVAKEDITFANVWGACDEDLYRWTLREADAGHAAGRPFHHFVMTTSNHRPYTFPEGRIDLPSKTSGRSGAVKYTDYAIGKFLKDAAAKPWFKHTVFVIVADHCASSAGRAELPIQNYRIPLMIYSPGGHIAPGHLTTLTSQVDYPPTLLGLLGWTYPSRFFGRDIRQTDPAESRALLGTYQKLGLLKGGGFAVLKPVRQQMQFGFQRSTFALAPKPLDPAFSAEIISYYQSASDLFQRQQYNEVSAEEARRLFEAAGEPRK
ncbi:MAG: sulfatase-like hydrolase/transferase [Acidobacteria bacterium]|nr:sulfatase-like hydrolase/transferase [Acidobacteriota bacterium]